MKTKAIKKGMRFKYSRRITVPVLVVALSVGYGANVWSGPFDSYMVEQHIATYEEMGIHSLLSKYKHNTLDPQDLIDDIYNRIDQNDANDKNPILISKVPKLEADARVDKLKDLRAALPSSEKFDKAYPLWGIPFIVKDIVDVAGMETTLGSPAWTAFPNCDLPTPPSAFVDPIPVPDTDAFKDPSLLRFDLVGPEAPSVPSFSLETTAPAAPLCHAAPIANAPIVKPIADDTALIVQLALDAGAVLIGKANLDQFATGLVGTRSAYGSVRNVRNEDFITGGSSSGSAAAVALGWASFSYGTDTAGSGRVPAGFNHLVGYKPTPGLLSNDLTFPAVRSVDTNTILTLNAEDSRYVAEIIKKYDPTDPYARPEADTLKCSATRGGTKKFRFGVPAEIVDPAFPNTFMKDRLADIWASDPNGRALYLAAIERMKKIGGTAAEFEYRPWEDVARLLYGGASVSQRFISYGNYVLAKRPTGDPIVVGAMGAGDTDQLVDPTTYLIIRNALFNKATRAYADEWQVNLIKQQTIRPDWASFDFMLLPTTPTIYKLAEVRGGPAQVVPEDPNSDFLGSPTGGYADPIAGTPTNAQLASRARANTELNTRLGTYTNFANILQTSALALPAGFRSKTYGGTPVNDLPFGVTLFADTLKDCKLFPVAKAYEAQLAEDLGL